MSDVVADAGGASVRMTIADARRVDGEDAADAVVAAAVALDGDADDATQVDHLVLRPPNYRRHMHYFVRSTTMTASLADRRCC